MTEEHFTLIAGAAVTVCAFWIPAYLSRKIKHGEARFDDNGKPIDNE
ncbi:hypothetical protein ACFCW2_02255 [Qipengyuania sp. DSG2-2]